MSTPRVTTAPSPPLMTTRARRAVAPALASTSVPLTAPAGWSTGPAQNHDDDSAEAGDASGIGAAAGPAGAAPARPAPRPRSTTTPAVTRPARITMTGSRGGGRRPRAWRRPPRRSPGASPGADGAAVTAATPRQDRSRRERPSAHGAAWRRPGPARA